jgi:hypothetical protein
VEHRIQSLLSICTAAWRARDLQIPPFKDRATNRTKKAGKRVANADLAGDGT